MFTMCICDLVKDFKVIGAKIRKIQGNEETITYCRQFWEKLDKFLEKSCSDLGDKVSGLELALENFTNHREYMKSCDEVNELFNVVFVTCSRVILSLGWQNLADDDCVKESFIEAVRRCQPKLEWHEHVQSAVLAHLVEAQWTEPALTKIMACGEDEADKKEVSGYLFDQHPDILRLRLTLLLENGCEEFALNLASWLIRMTVFSQDIDILSKYLILLIRLDQRDQFHKKCTKIICHTAVQIIDCVRHQPGYIDVALIMAQTFLGQDLFKPTSYCCTKPLIRMWLELQHYKDGNKDTYTENVEKMTKLCKDSMQLTYFAETLHDMFEDEFLNISVSMLVKAFKADAVMLASYKSGVQDINPMGLTASLIHICHLLSGMFRKHSNMLSQLSTLTAFSLDPSAELLSFVELLYSVINSGRNSRSGSAPREEAVRNESKTEKESKTENPSGQSEHEMKENENMDTTMMETTETNNFVSEIVNEICDSIVQDTKNPTTDISRESGTDKEIVEMEQENSTNSGPVNMSEVIADDVQIDSRGNSDSLMGKENSAQNLDNRLKDGCEEAMNCTGVHLESENCQCLARKSATENKDAGANVDNLGEEPMSILTVKLKNSESFIENTLIKNDVSKLVNQTIKASNDNEEIAAIVEEVVVNLVAKIVSKFEDNTEIKSTVNGIEEEKIPVKEHLVLIEKTINLDKDIASNCIHAASNTESVNISGSHELTDLSQVEKKSDLTMGNSQNPVMNGLTAESSNHNNVSTSVESLVKEKMGLKLLSREEQFAEQVNAKLEKSAPHLIPSVSFSDSYLDFISRRKSITSSPSTGGSRASPVKTSNGEIKSRKSKRLLRMNSLDRDGSTIYLAEQSNDVDVLETVDEDDSAEKDTTTATDTEASVNTEEKSGTEMDISDCSTEINGSLASEPDSPDKIRTRSVVAAKKRQLQGGDYEASSKKARRWINSDSSDSNSQSDNDTEVDDEADEPPQEEMKVMPYGIEIPGIDVDVLGELISTLDYLRDEALKPDLQWESLKLVCEKKIDQRSKAEEAASAKEKEEELAREKAVAKPKVESDTVTVADLLSAKSAKKNKAQTVAELPVLSEDEIHAHLGSDTSPTQTTLSAAAIRESLTKALSPENLQTIKATSQMGGGQGCVGRKPIILTQRAKIAAVVKTEPLTNQDQITVNQSARGRVTKNISGQNVHVQQIMGHNKLAPGYKIPRKLSNNAPDPSYNTPLQPPMQELSQNDLNRHLDLQTLQPGQTLVSGQIMAEGQPTYVIVKSPVCLENQQCQLTQVNGQVYKIWQSKNKSRYNLHSGQRIIGIKPMFVSPNSVLSGALPQSNEQMDNSTIEQVLMSLIKEEQMSSDDISSSQHSSAQKSVSMAPPIIPVTMTSSIGTMPPPCGVVTSSHTTMAGEKGLTVKNIIELKRAQSGARGVGQVAGNMLPNVVQSVSLPITSNCAVTNVVASVQTAPNRRNIQPLSDNPSRQAVLPSQVLQQMSLSGSPGQYQPTQQSSSQDEQSQINYGNNVADRTGCQKQKVAYTPSPISHPTVEPAGVKLYEQNQKLLDNQKKQDRIRDQITEILAQTRSSPKSSPSTNAIIEELTQQQLSLTQKIEQFGNRLCTDNGQQPSNTQKTQRKKKVSTTLIQNQNQLQQNLPQQQLQQRPIQQQNFNQRARSPAQSLVHHRVALPPRQGMSPRAMSPRAMSPRAMSPRAMSPRAMSPRVMSPRAVSPGHSVSNVQPTPPSNANVQLTPPRRTQQQRSPALSPGTLSLSEYQYRYRIKKLCMEQNRKSVNSAQPQISGSQSANYLILQNSTDRLQTSQPVLNTVNTSSNCQVTTTIQSSQFTKQQPLGQQVVRRTIGGQQQAATVRRQQISGAQQHILIGSQQKNLVKQQQQRQQQNLVRQQQQNLYAQRQNLNSRQHIPGGQQQNLSGSQQNSFSSQRTSVPMPVENYQPTTDEPVNVQNEGYEYESQNIQNQGYVQSQDYEPLHVESLDYETQNDYQPQNQQYEPQISQNQYQQQNLQSLYQQATIQNQDYEQQIPTYVPTPLSVLNSAARHDVDTNQGQQKILIEIGSDGQTSSQVQQTFNYRNEAGQSNSVPIAQPKQKRIYKGKTDHAVKGQGQRQRVKDSVHFYIKNNVRLPVDDESVPRPVTIPKAQNRLQNNTVQQQGLKLPPSSQSLQNIQTTFQSTSTSVQNAVQALQNMSTASVQLQTSVPLRTQPISHIRTSVTSRTPTVGSSVGEADSSSALSHQSQALKAELLSDWQSPPRSQQLNQGDDCMITGVQNPTSQVLPTTVRSQLAANQVRKSKDREPVLAYLSKHLNNKYQGGVEQSPPTGSLVKSIHTQRSLQPGSNVRTITGGQPCNQTVQQTIAIVSTPATVVQTCIQPALLHTTGMVSVAPPTKYRIVSADALAALQHQGAVIQHQPARTNTAQVKLVSSQEQQSQPQPLLPSELLSQFLSSQTVQSVSDSSNQQFVILKGSKIQ